VNQRPDDPTNLQQTESKASGHAARFEAATRVIDSQSTNASSSSSPQASDFDFDGDFEDTTSSSSMQLGEYQILDRIGAGGMGQVYRARHRTMQRDVAVKILPNAFADNPTFVTRFNTEIRAIGRLMHPNIVTAFDAGYTDSVHYLVMEFVDGISLSNRVATQGVLSIAEAIDVLAQAASALSYAHSMGVVHRDIKPGNMMLTNKGVLKICDFGLADLESDNTQIQSTRHLVGTVEYMSPEQIDRPDAIDHRTDLYSLGATLFFLLTGRPLFTGELIHVALAHRQSKPPALYEVRNDCDLRLDSIFQRLVAKHPDDRYPDAAAIVEALEESGLRESRKISRAPSPLAQRPVVQTSDGLTATLSSHSTSSRDFNAIGIDLGMITSRASYVDSTRKSIDFQLDGASHSLRNMLWSDGDQIALGEAAHNYRASRPGQIFYGLQRWFGLPYIERSFAGRNVPPEVLVAGLLRQIMDSAKRQRANVSHAVVTVPACYDQLHRASLATASRIAGVELLQLLDIPLAAALSYLEQRNDMRGSDDSSGDTEYVLTVMLSGTACEASVLRVEGNQVASLGTAGDWKRGKLRWQHRLAEYLSLQFLETHKKDVRTDLVVASRLQRSVELAIDRLVVLPKIELRFEAWQKELKVSLTRERLLEIADDLVGDVSTFVMRAMSAAGIDMNQISRVLLVGDMFGIPQLRNQVKKCIKSTTPIHRVEKSDLARGAALQARHLIPPVDNQAPHAEVTTAYDIGLLLIDSQRSKTSPRIVVPRGTIIPHQSSRMIRLKSDSNNTTRLQFAESTRFGNFNWHRLGGVDLSKTFPKRTSNDPLQLHVEVDSSGIFSAKLTWLAGNVQAIVPTLADPMMDNMSVRQWQEWLETVFLCNT
jgi:serine/threonine protein kinase